MDKQPAKISAGPRHLPDGEHVTAGRKSALIVNWCPLVFIRGFQMQAARWCVSGFGLVVGLMVFISRVRLAASDWLHLDFAWEHDALLMLVFSQIEPELEINPAVIPEPAARNHVTKLRPLCHDVDLR